MLPVTRAFFVLLAGPWRVCSCIQGSYGLCPEEWLNPNGPRSCTPHALSAFPNILACLMSVRTRNSAGALFEPYLSDLSNTSAFSPRLSLLLSSTFRCVSMPEQAGVGMGMDRIDDKKGKITFVVRNIAPVKHPNAATLTYFQLHVQQHCESHSKLKCALSMNHIPYLVSVKFRWASRAHSSRWYHHAHRRNAYIGGSEVNSNYEEQRQTRTFLNIYIYTYYITESSEHDSWQGLGHDYRKVR